MIRIARWNGSRWSSLGTGMTDTVNALAWDGLAIFSGGYLYAGGYFTYAGGVPAAHIAKWGKKL